MSLTRELENERGALYDGSEHAIPQRLKEARIAAKMDQDAIAAKLSLSRNRYGHYEQGRAKLGGARLRRFAQATGVSVDYLLGKDQQPGEAPGEERIPSVPEDAAHLIFHPEDLVLPEKKEDQYALGNALTTQGLVVKTPERWAGAWRALRALYDQGAADVAKSGAVALCRGIEGPYKLPLDVGRLLLDPTLFQRYAEAPAPEAPRVNPLKTDQHWEHIAVPATRPTPPAPPAAAVPAAPATAAPAPATAAPAPLPGKPETNWTDGAAVPEGDTGALAETGAETDALAAELRLDAQALITLAVEAEAEAQRLLERAQAHRDQAARLERTADRLGAYRHEYERRIQEVQAEMDRMAEDTQAALALLQERFVKRK